MLTIKLTSGFSLQFDSLAGVLDWSPHWEIAEDFLGNQSVWNTQTGNVVGIVVYN